MKILLVEPHKKPCLKEIDSSLSSMQQVVGGSIEAIYPFEDSVAVVCNEEGKNIGLEPNRPLFDDTGHIYDYICGTFFVCGLSEDNFDSLPDDLAEKFSTEFSLQWSVILIGGKMCFLPEG